MDLSVVLVSYNTKNLLNDCLRSFFEQTVGLSYEVFVVDNASTDGSVAMIETEFPQAELIRNKENVGFARANNQAIRRSSGRYILLLNSDTLVLNDGLTKMVLYMEEHPKVGVMGCKVLYPDGTTQTSNNAFPNLFTEFLRIMQVSKLISNTRLRTILGVKLGRFLGRSINEYLRVYWDSERIREVDWVTAACLLVRRKALDEVGLLDERFFMYYEDTDLCLRIRQCGWKITYFPRFSIVHYVGYRQNKGSYNQLEDLERHRSRFHYFRKHAPLLERLCLRILIIVAMLTRLPLHCIGKEKRLVYLNILRLSLSQPL